MKIKLNKTIIKLAIKINKKNKYSSNKLSVLDIAKKIAEEYDVVFKRLAKM